jgi:uncharacterized protein (DUF2252 family)
MAKTSEQQEGRELRKAVPREEHAGWRAPEDRPDPVEVLKAQDATRVPDLVPIRHGRMLVSPFTFFRGTAAIMAWDLAHTPTTSLTVQACGDAHLMNFGVFAAPDRRLVFDLNDFDETLPAPFEWDLKRLAASVVIAARDNGFAERDQRAAARATVSEYQRVMAAFVKMPFLDVWYTRIDAEGLLDRLAPTASKKGLSEARKGIAKAQRRTSLGALKRFAVKVDGAFRIKPDPPVVVPIRPDQLVASESMIRGAFDDYGATLSPERRIVLSRYHFADFARKVVGVGSVGTEEYMLLLMGERDDDPLFLQLKEAQESVLAPYAGASEYEQNGERVVEGQRIMQTASDSFLGWVSVAGKDFYVRQLRDMKGSVDVAMNPKDLRDYARVCGATLARGHARSGPVGHLSGYIGKGAPFARALEEFAVAYADQNERDYQALLDAERDGRISVERGV